MEKIAIVFLLFIVYSFIGWIMEVILCSITEKKIVDRGFLIGPICPIYGCGALIITLTLTTYKDDWIIVFCMAVILSGILEYFTSWAMEKMFHARWWDYSHNKFNINGRICLETMIPFGILGLIIIYILNPSFYNIISLISQNIINVLSIIFAVIFVTDVVLSFNVISKVTSTVKNITNDAKKDNTNEITEKVKEVLRKTWRGNRLIEAFPKFETIKEKVKKVANETVEKGKKVIKKGKNSKKNK